MYKKATVRFSKVDGPSLMAESTDGAQAFQFRLSKFGSIAENNQALYTDKTYYIDYTDKGDVLWLNSAKEITSPNAPTATPAQQERRQEAFDTSNYSAKQEYKDRVNEQLKASQQDEFSGKTEVSLAHYADKKQMIIAAQNCQNVVAHFCTSTEQVITERDKLLKDLLTKYG